MNQEAGLITSRSRFSIADFLHSKSFTVGLILLLGFIGYALAPADLVQGDYSATISLNLPDGQQTIAYDFALGSSAGQAKTTELTTTGNYHIKVSGRDQFPYRLGERITYRVEVTDANGTPVDLPVEQTNSIIRGPAYKQVLPPTDHDGQALVFTMRVPYRARITTGLLFAVATIWLTEIRSG